MPAHKDLRPVVVRLLEKRAVDPVTGCWKWTGSVGASGYGTLRVGGAVRSVHRLAYLVFVGEIREGLEIDHVYANGCRHTTCFNPAHLEAVTHAENMRRIPREVKTHCKWGHEFTPDNTWTNSKGHRYCRACLRRCAAERQRRNAA